MSSTKHLTLIIPGGIQIWYAEADGTTSTTISKDNQVIFNGQTSNNNDSEVSHESVSSDSVIDLTSDDDVIDLTTDEVVNLNTEPGYSTISTGDPWLTYVKSDSSDSPYYLKSNSDSLSGYSDQSDNSELNELVANCWINSARKNVHN